MIENKVGVYILQSSKNGRYYIGSTINLDNRLDEHFRGQVKSTKYLLPLKLSVFIPIDDIKKARQIEYKLKRLKSKKIIEKIIKDKKITLLDD